MLGVKSSASSRALRLCLLGVATLSVAVTFTLDTADARRRHRHRSHAAVSSYSPSFSSIIVDANSGSTLQATSADSLRHPASLTKIMTLYMLFERLESGKMKLDTPMDVSVHASQQAPTKLGLRPGQTLRVEEAIDDTGVVHGSLPHGWRQDALARFRPGALAIGIVGSSFWPQRAAAQQAGIERIARRRRSLVAGLPQWDRAAGRGERE